MSINEESAALTTLSALRINLPALVIEAPLSPRLKVVTPLASTVPPLITNLPSLSVVKPVEIVRVVPALFTLAVPEVTVKVLTPQLPLFTLRVPADAASPKVILSRSKALPVPSRVRSAPF